jgi:hypothetical protein
MAVKDHDRNLLFGILAAQMDFISRDSFILYASRSCPTISLTRWDPQTPGWATAASLHVSPPHDWYFRRTYNVTSAYLCRVASSEATAEKASCAVGSLPAAGRSKRARLALFAACLPRSQSAIR